MELYTGTNDQIRNLSSESTTVINYGSAAIGRPPSFQ